MSTNIPENDTNREQPNNASEEGFSKAQSCQKSNSGETAEELIEAADEPANELSVSTGEPTSPTAFDYAEMDPSTATKARSIVARHRKRFKDHAIETGRDLRTMKLLLTEQGKYGVFLQWVTSEMELEVRTAQNYMKLAEEFGDKSEIVSHLPLTALYALAARSTPPDARAALLKRIAADKTISSEVIKTEVLKAREDKKADSEAKRRAALTDEQRAQEDADKAALQAGGA